jgi:hypothetical protein
MSDIVERLRERPSRYASETEEQAKERRQQEREEGADTIATLRAEVERLGKKLNVARYGEPDFAWSIYEAQMVDLRATNERLRALLEPFGKAADGFDGYNIKNPEEWFAYGGVQGSGETTGAITVGDLRRARAALAEEKKG